MSADTRLKALREKTSGSNDNFDNRIAALRSTPAATSGNPADLLPKPQGNGYVSMADLNRQSNGSGVGVTMNGANGTFRNNYGYGNLDLTDRPIYVNPDGSYSTVRSLSVGFDDDTVLIPTVGWDANRNPVQWTNDEAIQHYLDTGEHLGKFKTQEAADQYGQWLHNQQEAYYNNNPTVVALRDRQNNGKSTVAPGTPGGGRGVNPPTFWERVRNVFTGAAKQYAGTMADAPSVIVDARGGTVANEIYDEQLADVQKRRNALAAAMAADPEYAKDPEAIWQLQQYDQQLGILGQSITANQNTGAAARDVAQQLTQSGAADVERASEGLGTAGKFLVNTGVAGLQMAGDVALGALTGGGNMAPMLMRSFGGGTQEARSKGYSTNQQLALGLTSAATEYFTEKLFGGNPIYDKADVGLVNKAINAVLQRIDPSVASRVMSVLSSTGVEMLNEGWEEVASDLLNPMMEQIITGNHDPVTLEQLVEDWAVGVALGGMGTGSTAAVEAVRNAPTKTTNAAINNAYAAAEQYGMFSPEARAAAEAATKKTEKAERRARRDNGYYQNVLPTPEEYEENAAAQSGEFFGSMGQEAVRAIVDTGLESATGTESRTLAEQYAKKLDAGETLTEQEIGKLYRANLDAIQQEALQQGLSAQEYTTEQRTPMEVRKAELRNQSDLETLAAGTMGEEGVKLAAEKRGTMADTDPVAYYNEARQAYDMGRSGGENTFKGEILSTKEANAWYNAGINDAKEETNEQRQSGNESQGRVNGLDSQRQGGRLAEGAGGQLAGEAAEGQRDGGPPVQTNDGKSSERKEAAVKLGQAQALTSAAENGISNGTEAKTMHVISEDTMDQWHPEMLEVYNKGKQNGITVKYYTGRMALDDGHGVFFVRGLNVGDGSVVWIRADADEDIRKIADHEFFHTAEKRDPGLKQRILDKITENKQAKTLQALTQKYADKYDGSGLSEDEILSEICADAYGGIDVFAGITDAKDATAEQKARATDLSETVRGAVKESKPTGATPENTTTKASREAEENVPPEVQKTLEKHGATVRNEVVVADSVAKFMDSPEYHQPVSVSDLADMASHDTLPSWAEKYINGGGSKEALNAIQQFDDMIWKSMSGDFTDAQKLLQALVPSGHVDTDKFGPLRTNVEYRRSFDMDTSCPRTFQFVAYRNAIMKRLNRTLTLDESINLINLMAAYHQMIPCTYCYVENKRILKAAYYNNFYAFHNAVLNGVKDGLTVEDLRPKMYGWNAEKGKLTDAAEKTLTQVWMKDTSGYNPTIAQNYHTVNVIRNAAMHLLDDMMEAGKITADTSVNSLTNIIATEYDIKSRGALAEVTKMAEDWRYDAGRNAEHMYLIEDNGERVNKKTADRALELDNEAIMYANSASSAKTVDNYAPYGGELENISQEDREYILGMGGIRKHSSNDFRIDYVLDYFQFFADLAKGKWTGHTYTKNADYVRIFGRTGDMINMSVAFNDTKDGVTENVSEGMEHKLARELRKAYANAGIMAMVTSDKQLSYALNTDWVDMIIPFHNSGLPKAIWYNMKAWTDYTSVQGEALYNSDDKKAALQSRGIDIKNMSTEEVNDAFYETFGIKKAINTETGKVFAPHFFPYETTQHGVKVPGHNNSKARYMELCKEYGVHPRFDGTIVQDADGNDINVVDHPNYMKLIKETSRATENFQQPTIEFSFANADPYLTEKYGKQYGKKSVTPMDYAMARLYEEAKNGGYQNAEDDQFGIVDEFVKKYAGKGKAIGWLDERSKLVKNELDTVQDKLVDKTRKATLKELEKTEGKKKKSKVRSNFYAEKNMASRDTDYAAAVERGDMETAQRMVDEAAKAAGYNVKAYHGTKGARFNKFDPSFSADEISLFFTSDYGTASDYANARGRHGDVIPVYINPSGFLEIDAKGSSGVDVPYGNISEYVVDVSRKGDNEYSLSLGNLGTKQTTNTIGTYEDVVNKLAEVFGTRTAKSLVYESERNGEAVRIAWDSETMEQVPDSTVSYNKKIGTSDTRSIAKDAKRKGYKGVTFRNIVDTVGWNGIASTVYDVFDNTLIKSADPVTYDDNGNVIPLSERFNQKQEDIRYSREDDTNRLMQENIDLRQRLDVALADTKQTTAWRANAKDVARVAEDIIAATSSKESKPIVAQKIRSLVEAASNGGIDSAEMKDLALDIARGLLKRSSVLTTKDSTTYDGMRDYLKSVYINVPSEMRKEITDWKAFAAAHKAMRMKTAGVAISAVYKEMQKRMGKDYFPDIDSDIEKLRQIAEVLDTLTPVYDNPYSVNMAEATEETANSILESILNIGQAEPTYADRAKARENDVRELYQQKLADQKAYLQQRIQDEADKRKQQTEAVKQHYTEMQENRRLRKQDSEARQKLLRVAKRLQNRKLDAVNRAMVDQLIGDLDTVSVNLTNRSLTNLKELADWYDSYKDDPNFLTDPQVEKKLSRLEKRHIGEMTLDEVRDLTDVLRSIENALATYGKMVRIEDHRLISEMSEQSQENIRNTKGSKKNIADWLVTNTLAPERLLRRLTGYNDSDPLYMRVKELSEGQRKMMDYQMRAEALFSKWTNDKKLIERLRDKDTIKVRAFVDGKETTVEITPDMRMALYLHSLNDQNLKHIMNGGVRIPDIELYRNGDTKEAYSRGVTAKMSPDMVRGIANGMSAEERAFANAAKAYFNGMSRDEINAVSEALLGYSLANVENYFPIQTDDAFTMKEIDAIQNDGSIQGMGFTKERQNASNAIYLIPMTDVLKRSIQNHAKYVGMAIPVANMNRLWMANTKDGEADTTSGLKDAMRSKWGDRANEAVEKILTDVQNPVRKTDDVSKALAKVRSNYAGAVLTLNASVAMKQAASYPTAAAVLGWEPLLKAMKDYGKVDLNLIAKYTPLQWYRSQGYSTQELGDIKSQSGLMDKVLSAHITTKDGREVPLLNWIQGIDLLTTRKLWKASEYYVQQNQKDLRVGSDDYYKAVADIYNRVIEETQPNYTTMQRPQLLRSDNQLLQSLVMFKTQPFQNFNILYDAIGELRAAETMAKNGDPSKLKQAKQNAVNAVTSNLMSAVVFAAMTMAWALARRKREKYEDKEGNFNPWGQLGKDILSSELGMIPFGSDAYNLFASMFLGEKYYGMTNITSDSLSGMAESTLNAFNTLKDTVTVLLDGDDKTQADPEKIARKLFATAKDASKMLGLPMENVLNLMTAVYSNVASAVNGEYTTAYEILRLEKGFSASSSKSTAYDILYKAYQNDRDQYNELRRMMVDDGFKESNIDSAMKKRSSK